MSSFVSLNNSAESLEKAISLVYTSILSNPEFYYSKNQRVFYGHNLPKISKKLNVAGTVGFYIDNFSDCDWAPVHSKDELWNNRNMIMEKLTLKQYLSLRTAEKMLSDRTLFEDIILKLPVEYLFEEFYKMILVAMKNKYPFVTFSKIDLEKNFRYIYNDLPNDRSSYSIYGLEGNGKIGHYYMDFLVPEEYYLRRLFHLYGDLDKKISLSGNVGILLAGIDYSMHDEEYILGYRERKNHARANRDIALRNMHPVDKIIEPKNFVYNSNYSDISNSLNEEQMSNIVVAKVLKKTIKELGV